MRLSLSDKSGNLHSELRSFMSNKLPRSSLDNPLFSSQILPHLALIKPKVTEFFK